jgi:hypothetical protein
MEQKDLRAAVVERSHRQCEWPDGAGGRCSEVMAELGHIRTRGMGGRHSAANELGNVFAACEAHARISDLERPPHGTDEDKYRELRLVPGCGQVQPGDRIKPLLVEGLRSWIAALHPEYVTVT